MRSPLRPHASSMPTRCARSARASSPRSALRRRQKLTTAAASMLACVRWSRAASATTNDRERNCESCALQHFGATRGELVRFTFTRTTSEALLALCACEVDAFQHQTELGRIDLDMLRATLRIANAAEGARLQSLVKNARSEEHTSELQSRENLVCR